MVKPIWRTAMLTLTAVATGCNVIVGIDEGSLDPCVVPGAEAECDASSAGGAGGHSAGAGGEGAHVCGNGIIEPNEECDDKNSIPLDGCTNCVVDCGVSNAFKAPMTHHCYLYFKDATRTWNQANDICQAFGGYLATITSSSELVVVGLYVSGDPWIGASDRDQEGAFVWVNDEPWGYSPWKTSEAPADDARDCVKLVGSPPAYFDDEDCNQKRPFVCEVSPAGVTP